MKINGINWLLKSRSNINLGRYRRREIKENARINDFIKELRENKRREMEYYNIYDEYGLIRVIDKREEGNVDELKKKSIGYWKIRKLGRKLGFKRKLCRRDEEGDNRELKDLIKVMGVVYDKIELENARKRRLERIKKII
jgi:hypothetical protein